MWTCQNCGARVEDHVEACPGCVAVDVSADDPTPRPREAEMDVEAPTDYDVKPMTEPGLGAVECFIGVGPAEAEGIARQLAEDGIDARIDTVLGGDGAPIHRVRVPIGELGRAIALIDQSHKRRAARP